MDLGTSAKGLLRSFSEHDLLTYASAISFQAFFALIPLTLTALGLLGALDLQEVWKDELARDLPPPLCYGVLVARNARPIAAFLLVDGARWQLRAQRNLVEFLP